MNKPFRTILKIDSSALVETSVTRRLSGRLVENLLDHHSGAVVLERDVSPGLPFIDEKWVTANFTPVDQRTSEQRAILELSDQLIDEIRDADALVIAAPMYNFGVPASLKSYIDMICRAGVTFKYTDKGPVGLMRGKKAFLVVASGGTVLGSEVDFVTGYLQHVLAFIGIDDVEVVAAARVKADENAIEVAELAASSAL